MLRQTLPFLTLLAVLPASGCADVELDPPTGRDDVVVRIATSRGMGTVESFFVEPADLVLTGDGTGYREGEDGIETFRVSDEELTRVLRDAEETGLLDGSTRDLTADGVMDAGTTSITLDAGTVRRSHSVYALGDRDEYDDMADFVAETLDWAGSRPSAPYRPETFRVLVQDGDGGTHCETTEDPGAVAGEVLATAPLLPGDRCEAAD